jgi:TonB family protein
LPRSTTQVTCEHPDPPKRLKVKEPSYTDKARAQRIAGSVYTFDVIGRDGHVQHAELINSLNPGLDESTLTTIRNWQFKPAMCGSEPVQTGVVVETTFKLY